MLRDYFRQDSILIEVRDFPDGFERAVKQFKKEFAVSGLLREIKRREFHLSKNQKRRVKDRIAGKRRTREAKKKARFQARLENRKNKGVKV
jgi:ribosomal protein S21